MKLHLTNSLTGRPMTIDCPGSDSWDDLMRTFRPDLGPDKRPIPNPTRGRTDRCRST